MTDVTPDRRTGPADAGLGKARRLPCVRTSPGHQQSTPTGAASVRTSSDPAAPGEISKLVPGDDRDGTMACLRPRLAVAGRLRERIGIQCSPPEAEPRDPHVNPRALSHILGWDAGVPEPRSPSPFLVKIHVGTMPTRARG